MNNIIPLAAVGDRVTLKPPGGCLDFLRLMDDRGEIVKVNRSTVVVRWSTGHSTKMAPSMLWLDSWLISQGVAR